MTTSNQQNNVSTNQLWFSLASGPLLWAAFHSLIYAISSLACQKNFWLSPIMGPVNTLALVLLGITVLALGLMAIAGFRAYANWKAVRGEQNGVGQPEKTRSEFMAFSGIALNILFGAATLVTFLPALFFDPCA